MKLGSYKIDITFVLFAIVFIFIAIIYENMAFLSGVIVCLIFGIKKIKNKKIKDDEPK